MSNEPGRDPGDGASPAIPVLVVARSPLLRESLCLLLSTLGCVRQVAQAWDAQATVEAEIDPDVALVDCELAPEEIARAVRGVKARWPGVRVLALADDERQTEAAAAAGADGVVVKGTPPARLLAAVERLIGGANPSQTSPVADEAASERGTAT